MFGGSASVRTIQTVFRVKDAGTATLRNAEERSDELSSSLEKTERLLGAMGNEATSTAAKLLGAGGSVADLGADARDTAVDVEALQEGLDSLPDGAVASASTLSALAEEIDAVGGDATETWLQLDNLNDKTDNLVNSILPAIGSSDALANALDDVASSSGRSAVAASAAANRIDSLGDNALTTSAKMQALDHSTSGAATSSAGLTAALGPLRGRVSTLGPAFLAAAPAVAGLASSLGGVAIAAGTAGGALGGVFAGGLLQKAERMADANAAIADRAEALEKIFSNFKTELIGALDPIKTIANAQLVTDTFEGAVALAGEFATSLAGIAPLVRDLARSMGSSVLATAPAIFDELEATVRTLGPALEGMVSSGIESLPTALRFFRSEAEQLLPELRSFGASLIRTSAAVADFGSNILGVVLPALTPMVDLLGGVASASARLPKPLLAASGAAVVATLAVGTYGGVASAAAAATGVLATALGVVTAPISALSVGIGALVGLLTFGAAKLGLFSATLNAIKGTISAVASGTQYAVNKFLAFTGVGERIGAVLGWVGDRAATVGAVTGQLAGVLGELLRIGATLGTLSLLAPFAALLKLPELPGMIRGAIPQMKQAASELPAQIIAGLNSMGRKKYLLPVIGPVLAIRDGIERFGPQVKQAAMNLPGNIIAGLNNMGRAKYLIPIIGPLLGLRDAIGQFGPDIKAAAASLPSQIIAGLNSMGRWKYLIPIIGPLMAVKDFITNPNEWRDSGAQIPMEIARGIEAAADAPVDAVAGMVGDARDFLPFSPAERGPLSTIDAAGEGLVSTFATGIEDEQGQLTSALQTTLAATPMGMATTTAIDVATDSGSGSRGSQRINSRPQRGDPQPSMSVTIEEINIGDSDASSDDVERAARRGTSDAFEEFIRRISREVTSTPTGGRR